jgi:hypothetical protein
VLPAAQVKAYYTAWYPNDGPDLKEVGERFGEQEVSVSDVALWSARSMSWSAGDVAPGRYYFVVVVDPENAIGAYRMHGRSFKSSPELRSEWVAQWIEAPAVLYSDV